MEDAIWLMDYSNVMFNGHAYPRTFWYYAGDEAKMKDLIRK